MGLKRKQFKEINLLDPFFNSLKSDYREFEEWFTKKAENWAYVHERGDGTLNGLLYLKIESDAVDDITPALPPARRIKVGTFKIDAHGTKLGERFIKKIFDNAVDQKISQIYVTIFPQHESLIQLLRKYGFEQGGAKTTKNGTEIVLVRNLVWCETLDLNKNYPLIKLEGSYFQIGIYPDYHTRLLPDSILNNENIRIVEDVSYTNSINKIFLSRNSRVMNIKAGDKIVMYRTGDGQGPAEYRAVATSLCVAEEARRLSSFTSVSEFIKYARPHSVFPTEELSEFYRDKTYLFTLKFTYNIALPHRLTRHHLIEEVGIDRHTYPGFATLTREQFRKIAIDGGVDEGLIID